MVKEGDGKKVPAYRSEENVAANSNTETFAAFKLSIDNWRWADVPLYIRTGKRMPDKPLEHHYSVQKGTVCALSGKRLSNN